MILTPMSLLEESVHTPKRVRLFVISSPKGQAEADLPHMQNPRKYEISLVFRAAELPGHLHLTVKIKRKTEV